MCLLCEQALSEGDTVVVSRGLDTIRNSSVRRNDDIVEKLVDVSSICVHTECRRSYTRESNIASAQIPFVDKSQTLRSAQQTFDITQHCLFCGDECDQISDQKKPVDKRNMYEMRKIPNKESIQHAAAARNDEWGRTVSARVEAVISDLVAAEARYHTPCYCKFFKMPSNRKKGRPTDDDSAAAFDRLYSFLRDNDECQYSLEELFDKLSEYLPDSISVCSERSMKRKLLDHFGDDIIITCLPGKKSVICFRNTGYKILSSAWYTQKSQDQKQERLRIVKTAAAIVREDIRSMAYDIDGYAPADNAYDDTNSVVPETLNTFMDNVINTGKKGPKTDRKRKCTVINHAIITATRPRSFISMIQVGLSVYVHRHVGSRHLTDILYAMGVCSSYNEARRYEASAMLQNRPSVEANSFSQFVFDNADFNVRTLDGYGTFHSMGGIMCVTPGSAITNTDVTDRIKVQPTAATLAQVNKVSLQTYSARNTKGIDGISVKDLGDIRRLSSEKSVYPLLDTLWMCGTWLKAPNNPSWSGYMELVTNESKEYQTSKVVILPFVNLQPTSLDAIYTVLVFAAGECRRHGQKTCLVTFDQPLYAKAVDMVTAASSDDDLSSIVVRLGGFHLLMSFMGAVGYIMGGSGLKDVWSTIYATDSIEKMMTGHAFARALRAHSLTQLALAVIILQELGLNEDESNQLGSLHKAAMNATEAPQDIAKCTLLAKVLSKMEAVKLHAIGISRTAKLWMQYYDQVTLMHHFVSAERCGDWALHLDTVREMMPHFHAAGHFAYAKYAHLYLQEMSELEDKMATDEFRQFTSGYFTVRRSERVWAGVWTDMTIEQVLMKAMKTSGGLVRGRGMTDSVLSRWVLGMPGCYELGHRFEEFCGTDITSSEQHVDHRKSRQLRDGQDAGKLVDWFTLHPPLPDSSELMSIGTGVVGDETINCDSAVKVGRDAMTKMTGMTFGKVKLHRKDRVLSLTTVSSSVRLHEEIIPINTMQLFNRIICLVKSDEDFASCLQYELAPRPVSLFDDVSMRKTEKAIMYKVIETASGVECEETCPTDSIYVLDGGYLLRRVVWPQNGTYSDLYRTYVAYVRKHFPSNCHVSSTATVMLPARKVQNKIEGPLNSNPQKYNSLTKCQSPSDKTGFCQMVRTRPGSFVL